MDFTDSAYARPAKVRNIFRSPVIMILYGTLAAAPFAYRAVMDRRLAEREQVTYGIGGLCHESGRGRDTYCDYSFQIGDHRFGGMSRSDSELAYGQEVQIYYDGQNPRVNSLNGFSAQSWKSECICYGILAFTAISYFLLRKQRVSRESADAQKHPAEGLTAEGKSADL